MKTLSLLALLAGIAGCTTPVSSAGSDEAPISSPTIHTEFALPGGSGGNTSAITATLLFSGSGAADLTYPPCAATTFESKDSKVLVWVYLSDVPAGTHVAWAIVTGPTGDVVGTIPMAFSTSKSGVGSSMLISGWPSDLTVIRAHEADGAFELRGVIPRADWLHGKVAVPGAYTTTILIDDSAVPAPGADAAGSARFTITKDG